MSIIISYIIAGIILLIGLYKIHQAGKIKQANQSLEKQEQEFWEAFTIEEHVNYYVNRGETEKDAMKLVAKDRKTNKTDIQFQIKR